MPDFFEFFAGGGMVRAGLGPAWQCRFANDFDGCKADTYRANWGAGGEFHLGDIADVSARDLPGEADLMWGSSPCQDLSLAGSGAGLSGARSGAFFAFWRIVAGLRREGRAPRIVTIENVGGALTSNRGRDFEAMIRTFADHGYRAGALMINADLFVPQSRPRLFVVGVRADVTPPSALRADEPARPFHDAPLRKAVAGLPTVLREGLIWWNLPAPPLRNSGLGDLMEEPAGHLAWHDGRQTARLLSLMSPANRAKVEAAKAESRETGRATVGTVYRRTRTEAGQRVQRAEARFDNVAGCLRTPSGGSSRQTLIFVEGDTIRSRLVSARETARLMGLPEDYTLPERYHDAYHLTGDGVVVPVVRHLATHLFEPLLQGIGVEAVRPVRSPECQPPGN